MRIRSTVMNGFLLILVLVGLGCLAWIWQRLGKLEERLRREEDLRRAMEDRLLAWMDSARGSGSRVSTPARSGAQAESIPPVEKPAEAPLEPVSGWTTGRGAPGDEVLPPRLSPEESQPVVTATAKSAAETELEPKAERPGERVEEPAVAGGWPRLENVDWERFMGVRLFAWLGGLALFLGVAYFVRYSFEHDLIPPWARVLIGLVVGLGLAVGGFQLRWRRPDLAVTAQTLCATGVVVLYAALFAGHAFYHLPWLPQAVTFAAMVLVTAAAFYLALRLPGQAVAVLGLVGGFLTPILLSTGEDQPGALFSYVALLDIGLLAVALRGRWDYLAFLGAIGTAIMEIGWAAKFFAIERLGLAWVIFSLFTVLFAVAVVVARGRDASGDWYSTASALVSWVMLGFAGWLLGMSGTGERAGGFFAVVLVADLALLTVAWTRERQGWMHLVAGGVVFAYLAAWQARFVTPERLGWALGASLGLAVLHSGFPLVLRHYRPGARGWQGAQIFPPLAVLVLIVSLLRLPEISFGLWPLVLLLNLLALGLAAWAGGVLGLGAALILTGLATSLWIGRLADLGGGGLGGTLVWLVVFAALFGVGAAYLRGRREVGGAGRETGDGDDTALRQLPWLATLMPFVLLCQLVVQLRMADPTPVFAAGLICVLLLLGLTAWLRVSGLPLAGLGALALLEHTWLWDQGTGASRPGWVIGWCMGFMTCFGMFPWVVRRWGVARLSGPWIAAALGILAQFHMVYRLVDRFWPNEAMGLLPLAFAVPAAAGLWGVARRLSGDDPVRREGLAWFGGVTLFLVTVALPIQFERQWLTLGLAMEGAALLWLFRRVPHPGLRWTGFGLFLVVFVRLMLNPAVLEYAERGSWPIWNRWLYTYGLAATAFFLGARWLLPSDHRFGRIPGRGLLTSLGVILVFALVNLEIADFFTPVGGRVEFDFTGHFGRDMTYTIAWALFALALVGAGITRRLPAARWAGLGLLGVALVKLFTHDLARLEQLYRVGALVGVAIIAITASLLYQRFVAREATGKP